MENKIIIQAKKFIEGFRSDFEKSRSPAQKKYLSDMVNSFVALVNLVEGEDSKEEVPSVLTPFSKDLECAVIGAIMIENSEEIMAVLDDLIVDVFYVPQNKVIFQCLKNMRLQKLPIDLLTVSDFLIKNKRLAAAGGDRKLIHVTQTVSSTAHVDYHSKLLLEYYFKRLVQELGVFIRVESSLPEVDVFDLVDKVSDRFTVLNSYIKELQHGGN